jgi:DNA-binding NarL/FixJ family response regulator
MRVFLVGSSSERSRLRSLLADTSIDIVGEFPTQAAALASGVSADATMLAAPAVAGLDEPPFEPLTAREAEVLGLVAEGFSNKAIAERLGISDQTVKFHVASLAGKLGASNRTEAVRLAVRQGLIVL